jgi:hypothetical protein
MLDRWSLALHISVSVKIQSVIQHDEAGRAAGSCHVTTASVKCNVCIIGDII